MKQILSTIIDLYLFIAPYLIAVTAVLLVVALVTEEVIPFIATAVKDRLRR